MTIVIDTQALKTFLYRSMAITVIIMAAYLGQWVGHRLKPVKPPCDEIVTHRASDESCEKTETVLET